MSKKEVFDAEAALDAILEDIELGGWSPRSDFVAEKTGFFHGESKWRTEEKTKPFTDWLQDKAADGEEKKNKNGGLIRVLDSPLDHARRAPVKSLEARSYQHGRWRLSGQASQ